MVEHLSKPLHIGLFGAVFAVQHQFSCPRGGFLSLRHNKIKDLTTTLLTEVCNDVQVKPELQEIATARGVVVKGYYSNN